jgi:D-psicose/D-tagatose/L-ribulose 3-epimerase
MPKLGLHTFAAAPSWDVPTFAALAGRLRGHGVGAIEIPLLRPEEIDVTATRAFAEAEGFELVCSLGLPDRLDMAADPDPALDFLTAAFDVAERLGAPALSGVTYGAIGKTTKAPRTAAEREGMVRFLTRAAGAAGARGLRFGIEPCNRYETHLLNTAADAVEMCEAVGAENLMIHLDTYHMHIEETSFAEAFALAAPHLGYVHLSEANRGVPGAGMIDWSAAFAALAAIGYDGTLTLESMNHVDPDIAAGLAVWRPVAARPDDVIDEGLPFLRARAADAGLALGR